MIFQWITNLSNTKLLRIASLGGIATVTMGLMTRSKFSNNVKQTDYCKEALATLRSHKGAAFLLGEPIRDLRIDVGDQKNNFTKGSEAQYQIPVSGTKQRGTMYLWAEKQPPEDKWIVCRIELELKNDPYKRLLIRGSDKI